MGVGDGCGLSTHLYVCGDSQYVDRDMNPRPVTYERVLSIVSRHSFRVSVVICC